MPGPTDPNIQAAVNQAMSQIGRQVTRGIGGMTANIRYALDLMTKQEENTLKRRINLLQNYSGDAIKIDRDLLNAKSRALAVLQREENKSMLDRQFATQGIMGKTTAIVAKQGIALKEGIEDSVGSAIGFNVTGMLDMIPGLGELLIAFQALKFLIEGYAKDLQKTAGISIQAGVSLGSWGEAAGRLRTVAGLSAFDFDELTQLMGTAGKEGGLAFQNLADTAKSSGDAMRIGMEADVADTVMNVSRLGQVIGMSGDDAVKLAFKLARQFGTSTKDITKNMSLMAAEIQYTGIPTNQLTGIMGMVGNQFEFLNEGFDQANAGVMLLFKGFQNFSGEAKNSAFWANKSGKEVGTMIQSAVQAFAEITPEQLMAYSDKPIGDFGEAFMGALGKNLFEKADIALKTLVPIAERAGTKAGVPGYLLKLFPQLGAIGGPQSAQVARVLVDQFEKGKLSGLSKLKPDDQIAELQKMGANMDSTAQAIMIAGDVNKAILSTVMNFLAAFRNFGLQILTSKLFTSLFGATEEQTRVIKEQLGMKDQAAQAKGQVTSAGLRKGLY